MWISDDYRRYITRQTSGSESDAGITSAATYGLDPRYGFGVLPKVLEPLGYCSGGPILTVIVT